MEMQMLTHTKPDLGVGGGWAIGQLTGSELMGPEQDPWEPMGTP